VTFLGTGIGFTVAALYEHGSMLSLLRDSKDHYYSEVDSRRTKRNVFTALAGSLGGFGALLLIPTAIYWSKNKSYTERVVVPTGGDGTVGLAVTGRF
jgi:hypothetical protein